MQTIDEQRLVKIRQIDAHIFFRNYALYMKKNA